MNVINIQNRQNYSPNFQAKLKNNYPLKGLLVNAIENPKYKEPLNDELLKLKDIYTNTELEFSKRKTISGIFIPVINNLKNGNTVSGFSIIKKGYTDFLDISYKLIKKLNEKSSEEHFQLFEQKGIRARNNSREIYRRLLKQSEEIRINDGYLDNVTSPLMSEFEKSASFKRKNNIIIRHRKFNGHLESIQPVYLFTLFDDNFEKTSKTFRIVKDQNGFYIKRNDFMNRVQILDILNDYLPKYIKLYNKTKIAPKLD